MFVHVTYVPYLKAAKEFKTKPTQHSVKELKSIGINSSNIHIDFMIGTPDLEISADTNRGKQKIFTKGNFSINNTK